MYISFQYKGRSGFKKTFSIEKAFSHKDTLSEVSVLGITSMKEIPNELKSIIDSLKFTRVSEARNEGKLFGYNFHKEVSEHKSNLNEFLVAFAIKE